MAVEQRNFQLYTYVDGNGVSWNKRGEASAPRNAIDGHAVFVGGQPAWGRETRRHRVRKVIFRDPTTFRTKTAVIYTPTAFNAVVLGTTTLAELIEGETGTVNYVAYAQIEEKQPSVGAARQLAEHA
jgi:hypothetical protein